MSFQYTDCLMVIGRRGCGKTFLSKNLQKIWPKKIIIDTLDEYEGQDVVYDFESFTQRLCELKNSDSQNFELIVRFNPESRISATEFDEICRLVWYFKNVQLVVEEVQSHASPHYLSHWLKHCMLKGRHHGISVLATTQRPGELNKTILSQCAHIFCGSLFEPNDVLYMSKTLGVSQDDILALPDRTFYYKSAQGVTKISNNL